jgi:pentose-5-phosphate-3-epimerase
MKVEMSTETLDQQFKITIEWEGGIKAATVTVIASDTLDRLIELSRRLPHQQ